MRRDPKERRRAKVMRTEYRERKRSTRMQKLMQANLKAFAKALNVNMIDPALIEEFVPLRDDEKSWVTGDAEATEGWEKTYGDNAIIDDVPGSQHMHTRVRESKFFYTEAAQKNLKRKWWRFGR